MGQDVFSPSKFEKVNKKEDLKELVNKLRKRLNADDADKRVANFLNVSLEELKTFGRITGHSNIHDICVDDLCIITG